MALLDSLTVTYEDGTLPDGKPHELKVRIDKMPALQAERWYTKVMLYMTKGVNSDAAKASDGFASILAALSAVPEDKLFALEDDLLRCCSIMNGGANVKCDPDSEAAMAMIQLPTTITRMRIDALKANFDFLKNDPKFGSLFGNFTKQTADSTGSQPKAASRRAALSS